VLLVSTVTWTARRSRGLTSRECEVYIDRGFHLDGVAVQKVRFILPLLHRVDGCGCKHWMAAYQRQTFNRPVLTNCRLKYNRTLDTRLPRQCGIFRRHLTDQQTLRDALGYSHSFRRSSLRHRHRDVTDDASEHTTDRSAGCASGRRGGAGGAGKSS